MSTDMNRARRIASARPRAAVATHGTRTTTVSTKDGRVDTEQTEAIGPTRRFPADSPPAYVSVAVGQTVKIGEFEFLRMDVGVTLPVEVDRIDEGYEEASEFAADKLNEEYNRWLGKPETKPRGTGRR